MLRGLPPGPPAASPDASPSLTPLILFAANPGTITGVITLSVAHGKSGIPVSALDQQKAQHGCLQRRSLL